MPPEEHNLRFDVDGVTIDVHPAGLKRVTVDTEVASGELFLHGAHCTRWQPAGQTAVLWMSQHSYFQPDKPIRGGVPICFPWFGPHAHDKNQPAHGSARLKEWELVSIERDASHSVSVQCRTRIEPFDLQYAVTFGKKLTLSLTTRLPASHAVVERFEDALHTYLFVSDIHQVRITGLESVPYIDKVDGAKLKPAAGSAIEFTGETDRVYANTEDTCVLHDPGWSRRIIVSKRGSCSSIVWNPWIDKSARMPDFGNDEWPGMLCIETANVGTDAVELQPGQEHTTTAELEVLTALK